MDGDSEIGDYVPLAERLRKLDSKTPDRFKRQPVLRESNAKKWVNRKATKARAPRFATDTRSTNLRRQREENRENVKKKTERKIRGAPNLSTAVRATLKEQPQPETFDREFKAKPVPKCVNRGPVSSRSSSVISQTTKVEPFSFDRRPTRSKPAPEPAPQPVRAHPAGALPTSLDRPTGIPEKNTKSATRAKPFNFATAKRDLTARSFDWGQNSSKAPNFVFGKSDEKTMRKALRGHKLQKPETKESTVPQSVSYTI